MEITFAPVTKDNMEQVLQLKVARGQETYIEPVEQCLEEAREFDCWRPEAIYGDGGLVGFCMYCFWAADPPAGRVWLDRLLIDERFQGQGYGKKCLALLVEKLKALYLCEEIYLSVTEGNEAAAGLYQQFGFRFNGETDTHGEKVMVLKLHRM